MNATQIDVADRRHVVVVVGFFESMDKIVCQWSVQKVVNGFCHDGAGRESLAGQQKMALVFCETGIQTFLHGHVW